ncbi:porin [Robbsia betulipollinis]|nr:porin [Robbsia betulipollinis]
MKKLVCFASGVVAACVFQTAHAQSAVTLYGVIDNGVEYQKAGASSVVRVVSGGRFASRFGLKGSEDIGDGLHVNFQLEQGYSGATGAASNSAAAFSRQAWVGVSGGFGEVRVGLQNTLQYAYLNPELDPVSVMTVGSPMNSLNSLTVRVNNAISYLSPTLYGFTGQFMIAARDSTTKPSNGLQFYNGVIHYATGPFRAAAGYEQAANATGTSMLKIFSAATSLGVGAARFFLAYHTERQTDNTDKRDVYEVSGSYDFNVANKLSLMYGYAHDKTGNGNNAQQVGLTYEYFVSKAVTVYGSTSFLQNRNRAQFAINGTAYTGIPVAPGADARAIMVGMLHRF